LKGKNAWEIFSRTGYKLPDAEEEEMEKLISERKRRDIRSTEDDIGKAKRIDDAIGRYIVFCKNTFPDNLTLAGMKIVLDCANGASYKVAPIIFSELGAEVSAIHVSPNGMNINDNCGSQYTNDLKAKTELGDQGRILIRYSGTQNMCRVMVEGPTDEVSSRLAEQLADIIRATVD
jgi:phosphoglucosamine mutase